MITLSVPIVLGPEAELRIHLRGAPILDIPREKIEEVMIHLTHYGAWRVAVSVFHGSQQETDPRGEVAQDRPIPPARRAAMNATVYKPRQGG